MHGRLRRQREHPRAIYRSQSNDLFISGRNLNSIINWRANLSFVTGAHSFKAGYASNLLGDLRSPNRAPNNLDYRVNNGVPNQFTMWINNFQNDLYMRDDGVFRPGAVDAQAPDAAGRHPLRPGHQLGSGAAGGSRPLPAAADLVPRDADRQRFNDITPRVAAAYDLFGTGKTAIKTTFGKYLEAAFTGRAYASGNPTSRIIQSVNRAGPTRTTTGRPTAIC